VGLKLALSKQQAASKAERREKGRRGKGRKKRGGEGGREERKGDYDLLLGSFFNTLWFL